MPSSPAPRTRTEGWEAIVLFIETGELADAFKGLSLENEGILSQRETVILDASSFVSSIDNPLQPPSTKQPWPHLLRRLR